MRSDRPPHRAGMGAAGRRAVAAALAAAAVVLTAGCAAGSEDGTAVVQGEVTAPAPPTTERVRASTTTPRPTTTAPERNLLGGDDPEDRLMPDVVCMDLQEAQDEIQDHGVFLSRSEDATGEGRRQILDRNWIVVRQDPPAGTPIDEGEAVLSVVKDDEPNPC